MYKVNFYREYADRKRLEKRQSGRTAAFAGMIGVELFLLGSLVVSGHLAGSRAESLRGEIARQSTTTSAQMLPDDQRNLAWEIHEILKNRIDWSPKLAALPRMVQPCVVLEELVGQTAQVGGPARMSMKGRIASSVDAIDGATEFLKDLREDPAFQGTFPTIRLGTVQGDGERGFEMICESAPEAF